MVADAIFIYANRAALLLHFLTPSKQLLLEFSFQLTHPIFVTSVVTADTAKNKGAKPTSVLSHYFQTSR